VLVRTVMLCYVMTNLEIIIQSHVRPSVGHTRNIMQNVSN